MFGRLCGRFEKKVCTCVSLWCRSGLSVDDGAVILWELCFSKRFSRFFVRTSPSSTWPSTPLPQGYLYKNHQPENGKFLRMIASLVCRDSSLKSPHRGSSVKFSTAHVDTRHYGERKRSNISRDTDSFSHSL